MKRVYLVGTISEDIKTRTWRKEATKLLKDKFEIDDPSSSIFDKGLLKEANGDYEKMQKLIGERQSEILLPKSFQSVMNADIILVNLSMKSENRPMVGTFFELAWAYQNNKTIIAIRGTSYYSFHPMVLGCVHAWSNNVQEATDIIREFFT